MIGGNLTVTLQQNIGLETNGIGEDIQQWSDIQTMLGFLDLSGGDSKYTHNAKLQESTHIFVCDYYPIADDPKDKRIVANGKIYDVLLIDDPMGLHAQLEIYLKFLG